MEKTRRPERKISITLVGDKENFIASEPELSGDSVPVDLFCRIIMAISEEVDRFNEECLQKRKEL